MNNPPIQQLSIRQYNYLPLSLIGMMGTGKTSIGRLLSRRLKIPLLDSDQFLEQQSGKSIAAIFSDSGESAFRDMETCFLENLAQQSITKQIISTGGGIILRSENRELLRKLGAVIWLDADFETIRTRIENDTSRPLLNTPDYENRIRTLLTDRQPLYAQTADFRIDTRNATPHAISETIISTLNILI